MSKEKLIAYVGPFSFPEGGAAARRILGNCKTMMLTGYRVIIGSGQMPVDSKNVSYFQDIEVHSIGERSAEHLPGFIKNIFYLGMGSKTVDWLNSLDSKPEAVVLYSGYSPYLLRLLPWCKKNNIPLIFDAVEWYDPPSLLKGILSPYYWNIELAMRYLTVKTPNIIVISSYLEKYYKSKKCNTVLIPPTLDVENINPRLEINGNKQITIGYTGTPGHKDLFDNVLKAILSFDLEGKYIRLKVAGITEEELMKYPSLMQMKISTLPKCIETIGKVTHTEAIDLIRNADFSVLLRPNKRYAEAGFPTKLVESVSLGTPIITNITSDIGMYINHKVEGIICNDYESNNLIDAFKDILLQSEEEKIKMRNAAYKMALEKFDYRIYYEDLQKFIQIGK